MRGWIRQWVGADQLPPGVTQDGWAATVLGAVMGIHQQWRIAPDEVDLDQAAAALRAMVQGLLIGGDALHHVEEPAHQRP
jgi:TetR/AcrR family acrAB operon transcriptional repressor